VAVAATLALGVALWCGGALQAAPRGFAGKAARKADGAPSVKPASGATLSLGGADGDGGGAGPDACTACNIGSIACGTTREGNLNTGDCQLASDGTFFEVWTFPLAQATEVTITQTSTAFDSFLILADAACAIIAFDDDSGGNLNSRLVITLPAGNYFIAANTFAFGERGNYQLSVTCSEPADLCGGDCTVAVIGCAETLSGTLEASDCTLPQDGSFLDIFEFTLAGEQGVTINLSTAAFDPFLWVYGSDCVPVAANDDCTEGDFSLSCLTVNLTAGTWFIGVNSFSAGEVGPYDLTVVECGEPVNPCEGCQVGTIACNETVTGELPTSGCAFADGRFVDVWAFELPGPALVTVEMTSVPLDPFVLVFREDCGDPAGFNDDCTAGDLDLSCVTLDLTAGRYWIAATSFGPGEQGAYTLTVTTSECEPLEPPCVTCRQGTIACGTSTTANLTGAACTLDGSGEVHYWQLDLPEPRSLTIRHRSGAFDPLLAVYNGECEEIARNDDCDASTLNSCLALDLAAGTYFLAAASLFSGEAGEYALSVECAGGDRNLLPGDCNADGLLQISDAVCLFRFLFAGSGDVLPCADGGLGNPDNVSLTNWNGDASVDISDGIGLLNYLFLGGAAHVLGVDACVALASCPDVCVE
jgi:hypothetical protein